MAFSILHLTQVISLVIVGRSKGETAETVPGRYIYIESSTSIFQGYRCNQGMRILPDPDKLQPSDLVQAVADRMFERLARMFPVCSASDEFYYFPQVQTSDNTWSRWDDFSPETVDELASELLTWEDELSSIDENILDRETRINISLLCRIAHTLREELTQVRIHQTQPTFYLSVASIGLAEALDCNPLIWDDRVESLPAFLDCARMNLLRIPVLFRDLGIEMTRDTRLWLTAMRSIKPGLEPVLHAIDQFEKHLLQLSTYDSFLMDPEIYERVVFRHIGCRIEVEDVRQELSQEISDMKHIMEREAKRLGPCSSWAEAIESLPLPALPQDGLIGLYREEVLGLEEHCIEKGLVTRDLLYSCPVRVEPVPSYLSAIRSAAAYSMPPGYPPRGGTFFIFDSNISERQRETIHRDFRMIAAHETWPGHHLLDMSRWNLNKTLRRSLEFPLFYEGWACFAEELMEHTGYFQGPAQCLLLATRNFRRAIRGKIDLDIQTGRMDISKAASCLVGGGINRKRAVSIVRRYALKPGYQVCYAIGLRRFRNLYERFGRNNPGDFVRKVLSLGEIDFDDLEEELTS